MIKMESGKNNRKETYANEQWPFVITIWNKTATQAGGQDLAGIYYAKI